MKNITEIIDEIDFDDDYLLNEIFTIFNVSWFDHYLTVEEYNNTNLVSYSDIKEEPAKKDFFNIIKNKFLNFYKQLYILSAREVIILTNGKKTQNASLPEYNQSLSKAMEENPLCGFLYPNLDLYVMTGYDLTHSFYLLKSSNGLFEKINYIIKEANLFVLK